MTGVKWVPVDLKTPQATKKIVPTLRPFSLFRFVEQFLIFKSRHILEVFSQ